MEMLAAVQRVLEQVRSALTSDSERAQFDALFRPGGAWRLDLHGAALDIARLRSRRLQWDDVVPALRAS
jgi:putative intracellular protease/amidase